MSEPSLTEFLLARIAEDESEAFDIDPTWPPRRMLAECEAKRRIVERHYTSDDVDEPGTCGYCGSYFPCHDLRALALPYADQPRLPRRVAPVNEPEECGAQYGSNPDTCYLPHGHAGPHSNKWGTTWAADA